MGLPHFFRGQIHFNAVTNEKQRSGVATNAWQPRSFILVGGTGFEPVTSTV
jgi:hypothetical protein